MDLSIRERIIIMIVIFLCIFSLCDIGFAKNIEKTFNSKVHEDFNVEFCEGKIISYDGINNANILISKDHKDIYLQITDLLYPGAYAKFSVNIINLGSLSAKIETLVTNGFEKSKIIKFRLLDEEKIYNTILKPGENVDLDFIIEWDKNSVFEADEELSFNIQVIASSVQI